MKLLKKKNVFSFFVMIIRRKIFLNDDQKFRSNFIFENDIDLIFRDIFENENFDIVSIEYECFDVIISIRLNEIIICYFELIFNQLM